MFACDSVVQSNINSKWPKFWSLVICQSDFQNADFHTGLLANPHQVPHEFSYEKYLSFRTLMNAHHWPPTQKTEKSVESNEHVDVLKEETQIESIYTWWIFKQLASINSYVSANHKTCSFKTTLNIFNKLLQLKNNKQKSISHRMHKRD